MKARVQPCGRKGAAVARSPELAAEAGLADAWTHQLQGTHRMTFPER